LFNTLVEVTAGGMQIIDSTTAKAHRSAGGRKGGASAQVIGRSCGGRTTKIHAAVDGCGRLIAFEITPGQLGDVRTALGLLGALPPAAVCAAGSGTGAASLDPSARSDGTPVLFSF
jgi:hypothetical protein